MRIFKLSVLLLICVFLFSAGKNNSDQYQCLPCGQDCDKTIYDHAGKCPHCEMELVSSSSISFKSIEASEICNYLKAHPRTVLLDVRTKEEFEGKISPDYGTLKNAINIPIQALQNRISDLNEYKDREIIVFCSHSHRSPQACYLLTKNGFTKVINMSGGMSALEDSSCKK